jgi:hypothetical protein
VVGGAYAQTYRTRIKVHGYSLANVRLSLDPRGAEPDAAVLAVVLHEAPAADVRCLGTREEADALPVPAGTLRTWLTATPTRIGPEILDAAIWLIPTCATKEYKLTVEHTTPRSFRFHTDPIHGQCLSETSPDPLVVEAW